MNAVNRKCCLVMLIALTSMFALSGRVMAQPSWVLTGAEFEHPPASWNNLSSDRRTMTTTLPPASTINSSSPEISSKVSLSWGNLTKKEDVAYMEVASSGMTGNFVCFPSSQSTPHVGCKANSTWAATLTSDVVVNFRVKQTYGNSVFSLAWRFEPTVGGPFVASLTTAKTVVLGDLATFRITLTEDAPSNGKEVAWDLIPADCFTPARGAIEYEGTKKNHLTITQGDRWRDFSVATVSCVSTSAQLRTWVDNENTTTAPYYKARHFALVKPKK